MNELGNENFGFSSAQLNPDQTLQASSAATYGAFPSMGYGAAPSVVWSAQSQPNVIIGTAASSLVAGGARPNQKETVANTASGMRRNQRRHKCLMIASFGMLSEL